MFIKKHWLQVSLHADKKSGWMLHGMMSVGSTNRCQLISLDSDHTKAATGFRNKTLQKLAAHKAVPSFFCTIAALASRNIGKILNQIGKKLMLANYLFVQLELVWISREENRFFFCTWRQNKCMAPYYGVSWKPRALKRQLWIRLDCRVLPAVPRAPPSENPGLILKLWQHRQGMAWSDHFNLFCPPRSLMALLSSSRIDSQQS